MPDSPAASATTAGDMKSLVAALVECNDQMVALFELLSVGFSSLDETTSLQRILDLGASLLDAELELWIDDGNHDQAGAGDESLPPASTRAADVVARPAFQLDAPVGHGRRDDDEPGTPLVPVGNAETAMVEFHTPDGSLRCRVRAGRPDRAFSTGDRKMMGAVTSVALASASISRRHAIAVEQAIVRYDYETASELARLAVPPWRTPVPGVDLFSSTRPARAAGGDLYQFALIDGIFWFAVGDVTGKGLASALIMVQVVSACGAAFQVGGTVESVVAGIDGMVHDYIDSTGRFVTLVVGRYDTRSGRLDIVNAGHSPVIRSWSGGMELVRPMASPIGVFRFEADDTNDVRSYQVEAGEYLVIGSDGLTEQAGNGGGMFGLDTLLDLVADSTDAAGDLGRRVLDRVDAFAAGRPQSDDQTLVVMKFDGTSR